MAAEAYSDWLSVGSLGWTLLRIVIVWLAFYGAGSMLLRLRALKKRFGLMPAPVAGMIPYMILLPVLQAAGLLGRTPVALMLVVGAVCGAVVLYLRLRSTDFSAAFRRSDLLLLLPLLLAMFVLTTDLMLAGRPELNFNDTQVTYLVHSDRWLNEGSLGFLDETKFSAYPLASELLLTLPSSLAADRMDQMILGQVFCMSMLLIVVPLVIFQLRISWRWCVPALIAVAGTSTLVLWSHFAKPDVVAVFLVTLALATLLRQMRDDQDRIDLSAFLMMGLALSTKYTSYLALIPFLIMSAYIWRRRRASPRTVLEGLLVMGAIPIAFAVRTALITGSPFYPHPGPFRFLLRHRWRMPNISLTYDLLNDRSSHYYPSVGLFENIGHYLGVWNSSLFLMAAGLFAGIRKGLSSRSVGILAGITVYSAASIALFYPAWWGAKYGILLIPFTAVWGLFMLRGSRHGLLAGTVIATAIYFVYESPLSPTENWGLEFRTELVRSYVSGHWTAPVLQRVETQPELAITMWMNSNLPEGSTILSLTPTKRYFSNHRWLNAWRYPQAAGIYLENSLEEEVDILESLGVDYLVFAETNPAPLTDEDAVELLCRMGRGRLLEPVASLDGMMVVRFSPENLRN